MPSSAPPPAKDGWAPQPDFSMTASQLARDLSLGTTKVQPGQGRWAVGYVTPPEYVSRASVRRGATMWPWRNHGHGHCPTGQVAGGVTSLEASSAARAADGNGNNRKCGGGVAIPAAFHPLRLSDTKMPLVQWFFNSTHPHWGKEPVAFFCFVLFLFFLQLPIYSMLTGKGWFPAIIREPTLGSRPQVGPVAVRWLWGPRGSTHCP